MLIKFAAAITLLTTVLVCSISAQTNTWTGGIGSIGPSTGTTIDTYTPMASVQTNTCIVAGLLTVEGQNTLKVLYGGKVPVLVGNVILKNFCPTAIQVGAADIYLSLGTVDTIPFVDASAALTKVYGSSKSQRIGQLAQAVLGGVGIAAATNPAILSVRTLGYLLFGATEFQQANNIFNANQPALGTLLANACDTTLTSSMALVSGGSVSCKVYIQIPAKGGAFPGAVAFQLVPTGPNAPGPLPPVQPVPLAMPKKLVGENIIPPSEQSEGWRRMEEGWGDGKHSVHPEDHPITIRPISAPLTAATAIVMSGDGLVLGNPADRIQLQGLTVSASGVSAAIAPRQTDKTGDTAGIFGELSHTEFTPLDTAPNTVHFASWQ